MLRKWDSRRREGLPCFDLFVGLLLWGMRNVRDKDVPEAMRRDEREPVPAKALH